MRDILSGKKAAFLWNMSAFAAGAELVAQLLARADMAAVMVKTHDGRGWYQQGESFRRIRSRLKRLGVQEVGAWGYFYFDEPAGELERVRESIAYGQADFYVFNIEDPAIETNRWTPGIAETLFGKVREAHPDYPLYFCSHAQPSYHERQPYWQAAQNDIAMMPMAYHTAMQTTPERSITLARNGLKAYELDSVPVNYAGALYGEPGWPILAADVTAWGLAALAAGSTGLSWWSLDVAQEQPELLDAVAAIPMPLQV